MKFFHHTGLIFACVLMLSPAVFAQGTVEKGKKIKFDYTLTVDGNVIDSSQGKQPIEFVLGDGMIIPGLAKQLEGMKTGEEKHITVSPQEGYGMPDPNAYREVEKSVLSTGGREFEVGQIYEFHSAEGDVFPGIISEIKDNTVVVNFNHPLAGKELVFDIKIVSVE